MGLKTLVFGAGAIGTYIGGSLALADNPVMFLELPQVAARVRDQGLHLKLPDGDHHLEHPEVCDSLSEALQKGSYDIAIFAMKSNDTLSALQSIAPLIDRMPPILCLQNGVENEAAIAGVLGAERVIPGSVTSAIGRLESGGIVLEKLRGIGIWSGHRLSPQIAQAFNAAQLNAHLYAPAVDMKWSKMLTNQIANATSALLGMTPAEIFSHPALYRLEILQLRETLRVMDAQGISVIDLPKTPVRLLAFAIRYLPLAVSRPFLSKAVAGGRGAKMPSFYLDLHSGRGTSEVDYLNGAVVRFGEKWQIPTPINRLLTETLLSLTRGDLPIETYAHQPGKLLEEVNKVIR